ncbi:unnamed protein product [Lasius platythorax]|uniref:Uncharacterized protein n=1 Tax=Lasius platythorax TaxID=488582 RepID=A0AAV2MWP5_9HYME
MGNNLNWLDTVITVSITDNSSMSYQLNRGGRPQKNFGSCSERNKRRKTSEICSGNDTEVLVYAAKKSLRLDGKHEEAKLMKEAIMTTPSRSKRISKVWNASKSITNVIAYTPAEALALMIETSLTKNSYQVTQTQANSRGANIYPSYKRVREAKAECYPPKESVHITDNI